MTCVIRSRSFAAALPLAALLSAAAPACSLAAQSPSSPSSTPATLAPYRAPLIALVQPPVTATGAGSVPLDRPVVVFRFAAGEADDPLDVGSFVVAVDGADRSALFQTTASQAWGPLADDAQLARGELVAGPHRVVARICSTRGACSTTEATLLVVPGVVSVAPSDAAKPTQSGPRRVLGAVLSATRKLLLP